MDALSSKELLTLQTAVAGRYAVEREIGRGGMGIVCRARDLALERAVAIKLLPPELALQQDLRERFLREARTAASLAHPHIVPIHLVEAHDDVVFFVMGYVDGETLTSRVHRAGALPALEVGRILQEVAWALGYAHGRGVVHRDIKPDNILIEHGTARAYVTDFGIARRSDAAALTREGAILGTVQFMSPEQASGEAIDGRSDIYALGVVAYFALTGRYPFDAPTLQATLAMHLTQPPPPLAASRADLPRPLIEVVNRCLAKEPVARFQTAEELAETLNALVAPTADIAPLVRNWLRVAEQWLVVLWILVINGLLIGVMEPRLAGVIAVLAAASVSGLSVDLITRTRQLLREGYTHEDIRLASLLERQLRERELQSVLGNAAERARRRRTVAIALRVAGVGIVATAVLAILKRVVPRFPPLVVMVGGFAGIITFAAALVLAVTSSARMQRSNLLYYTAVWRRWLGRLLFRVAGIGLRRARVTAPTTDVTTLVADLSDARPSSERGALNAATELFAQLSARAADLLVRERELDQAVTEAGAPPAQVIAAAAQGANGPGADGLLERRSLGVEQLRSARDEAARDRARMQIAADNLRIQLLRLRARAGSIGELEQDLATARALLDAAPGGRLEAH